MACYRDSFLCVREGERINMIVSPVGLARTSSNIAAVYTEIQTPPLVEEEAPLLNTYMCVIDLGKT
jgi:hypothetical protein